MSMGATEKAFKNFNFSQNFTLVSFYICNYTFLILSNHHLIVTYRLRLQR